MARIACRRFQTNDAVSKNFDWLLFLVSQFFIFQRMVQTSPDGVSGSEYTVERIQQLEQKFRHRVSIGYNPPSLHQQLA